MIPGLYILLWVDDIGMIPIYHSKMSTSSEMLFMCVIRRENAACFGAFQDVLEA